MLTEGATNSAIAERWVEEAEADGWQDELRNLVESGWHQDPEQRPSAQHMCTVIEEEISAIANWNLVQQLAGTGPNRCSSHNNHLGLDSTAPTNGPDEVVDV